MLEQQINANDPNNWWTATKNAADVVVSTFTGMIDQINPWHLVEGALYKHFYKPDVQAARILYSTVLAHYLKGPKVWTMVVAPPGSAKTELLHALDGLPRVHKVDSLSPNTFISGQVGGGKPAKQRKGKPKPRTSSSSYLHRIGNDGILVFKDFSTILEMKADHAAMIFAQMRKIYDGEFIKEFGTPDDPDHAWSGRLTFLAACTPAIDNFTSMFQSLGERFIMVRWPRAAGIEAGRRASAQHEDQLRADMKAAVHKLLRSGPRPVPTITDEMQDRITALTEVAVTARTAVKRSGYTKEIISLPEPESNTRFPQELSALAKGSALIDGRAEVNEDDFALVRRVSFDSMPPLRKAIIEALMRGEDLRHLTIMRDTGPQQVPQSTRVYALDDLKALNLVGKDEQLTEYAADMLRKALAPKVPPCLS